MSDETTSLVRELCDALEAEGVSYCHWKSNAFLDRSSRAENDLDFLVRRAEIADFSAIVHRLGFKEASSPSKSLPGVSNYYGYDRGADRLVHVHAHYQLVVGDDLTKNYRIPLENAFIDAAIRERGFRIPPPELELIVFVIRMLLKHSTWDAIIARRGKMSSAARKELKFLQARVDDDLLYRLLERHLPFIDHRVFAECLRTLDQRSAGWARLRAAEEMVAQLRPCARRSRAADISLKLWRRGVGILSRLLARPALRKRLAGGGAMIAVVGADGAGKSTVVDALAQWLSKDFAVAKVHLGRPPRSWTTIVVAGALKVRLGLAKLSGRRAPSTVGSTASSRLRMLFAVATARDRYTTYTKARRLSLGGAVVICDRFPLPQLTLMDAPRVERMIAAGTSDRLAKRLSGLERRYYRALTLPDVLIVLRVDPEIAVKRKPEEQADFIRARWREIWAVDWQTVPGHVVDASRPPDEVVSEVKSLLWSEL